MTKEMAKTTGGHASPFERIRKANEAGNEYWESRDPGGGEVAPGRGNHQRTLCSADGMRRIWMPRNKYSPGNTT